MGSQVVSKFSQTDSMSGKRLMLCIGAYAASLNPGAASFAPEANQSGLYLGMCFFTTAWFWLPGTPATAALIQGKTDYLPASLFCGCAVLGAGVILIFARAMRVKQVGSKWV